MVLEHVGSYWLQLRQQDFGLPSREYYLKDQYATELEAYRQYIVDIATFFNSSKVDAETDAADLIKFETYLANVSPTCTVGYKLWFLISCCWFWTMTCLD